MAHWLGITLGDPSGIGPEVALKALAAAPDQNFKYLLLGDAAHVRSLNASLGTNLQLHDFITYSAQGDYFVQQVGPKLPEKLECGSAIAAESAVAALIEGAQRSVRKEIKGVVTAPV